MEFNTKVEVEAYLLGWAAGAGVSFIEGEAWKEEAPERGYSVLWGYTTAFVFCDGRALFSVSWNS